MSARKSMQFTFANERDAPDVETQPRVLVHLWRLIKAPAGTLHLITLRDVSDEQGAVRVTSPITAIDRDRDRVIVTTSSGRRYELAGPAEERELQREMLRAGAVRLGMGDAVDISVFAWDLVDLD